MTNKEILGHEWDPKDNQKLVERMQQELTEAKKEAANLETEEAKKEYQEKLKQIAERLGFDSVEAMQEFQKSKEGAQEKPDYPQTRYGLEFVSSVEEQIPASPEGLESWLENLERGAP